MAMRKNKIINFLFDILILQGRIIDNTLQDKSAK